MQAWFPLEVTGAGCEPKWGDHQLRVRIPGSRAGSDEGADLGASGLEHPGATDPVAERSASQASASEETGELRSSKDAVLQPQSPVVAQIRTDTRAVMDHGKIQRTKVPGRPHPGELQDLRGLQCTGTHEDLPGRTEFPTRPDRKSVV